MATWPRSAIPVDRRFLGQSPPRGSGPLRARSAPDRLSWSWLFFFDRVEVRRVRRQVQKLAPSFLDQLLDSLGLVSGEVVHHHELPGAQAWGKYPLYIGLEDRSGGGALDRQAMPHPFDTHARKQGGVLAPVQATRQ